jgi:DNA-damage-inducible protein J
MAATTMLHVRVDDALKTQATQALAAMGLTVSDAVRMLLTRVAADQAFPLELKVPNAETRAAMEESRRWMKSGKPSPFKTPQDMFDALDHAATRKAR